jgi:cell surface protein SprA
MKHLKLYILLIIFVSCSSAVANDGDTIMLHKPIMPGSVIVLAEQTQLTLYLDYVIVDYETGIIKIINEGVSKEMVKVETSGVPDIFDTERDDTTTIDLRSLTSWVLASTPRKFPESQLMNDLRYGYNRAKLAWYVIDPLFLRSNIYTPDAITPEMQSSHFVREVFEEEIFPYKENPQGVPTNMPVLNLVYYPNQRGMYNYEAGGSAYSAGLDTNGFLKEPETRWGGIMREITIKDFELSKVKYINFWLMDPFIEDFENYSGGDLYFNIGDISEDILKDGRYAAEYAFTYFYSDSTNTNDTSSWGFFPYKSEQHVGFSSNHEEQDIGLDGLDDREESLFFNSFFDSIEKIVGESSDDKFYDDPSGDNYEHYRTYKHDAEKNNILQRYKKCNGMDGNSSDDEYSNEPYSTHGRTIPDKEEINRNYFMDTAENYYQYKVSIRKEDMQVGKNYIVEKRETEEIDFPDGTSSNVTWYHFMVPLKHSYTTYGSISDFKSIKFMRMFLSGFSDSVILRFARLELMRINMDTTQLNKPASDVLLYPNPNDGTFGLASKELSINDIKIYNMTGQAVYENSWDNINTATKICHMPQLASGTYIVRINTSAGVIKKRCIIQH